MANLVLGCPEKDVPARKRRRPQSSLRASAIVALAGLTLINVTASARGEPILSQTMAQASQQKYAALISVREWTGPYSFRYTERDWSPDGSVRKTEIDNGQVTFTEPRGSVFLYKGIAQASSSFTAVRLSQACGTRRESAHGATTIGTGKHNMLHLDTVLLAISPLYYTWGVGGFLVRRSSTQDRCSKSPKYKLLGGWGPISAIPLPSARVLCGTLDVRKRGHGISQHLTASWAFYPIGALPKKPILTALPASCAHLGNTKANQHYLQR